MTRRDAGRLVAWRRRDARERELDADLQAHLDLLVRDQQVLNVSGRGAGAAADGQLTFGGKDSRGYWGFLTISVRRICGMPRGPVPAALHSVP